MSRVVIDARGLRGTTGRYHREYLSKLEKLDQTTDYHVIIHTKDQTAWVPTNKNITMHVVKWDQYTFGEQLGLAKFLYSLKPDIVHFMMPQQPLLYFGKRITNIHDLTLVRFENLDKNRYVYRVEKLIFTFLLWNVAKRSKRILVLSNFVKKDLLGFVKIDKDKIIVAKPAASEQISVRPKPIKSLVGKDFIFFIGNAFPHKNLERLVEAFITLKKKHPKLQLVFAGKKDYFHNKLEEQYTNIEGIHFVGYISEAELAWAYKHTKAYVFPSLSEGFGLPGLEAMQNQAPVASSDATCLPEIYGDAAHYFNPLSTDDIVRAIDEVIRSKSRRDTLVKAGNEQFKKYSWERMAKKIIKQYSEV